MKRVALLPPAQRSISRNLWVGFLDLLFFPASIICSGLLWIAPRVSDETAFRLTHAIMSFFAYHQRGRRRRNIRTAFHPAQWTEDRFQRFDRDHVDHLARTIVQIIRLAEITPQEFRSRCSLKGEDHLAQALHDGKGVLLINDHVGNTWYMRTLLAACGYPVAAVTNRIPVISLRKYLEKMWEHFGISVTYVGEGGSSAAETAFQKNQIFSVSFDVCIPQRQRHGLWLPFGPALLHVDPGPARLAMRNPVPVLRAIVHEVHNGGVDVELEPAASAEEGNQRPEELSRRWLESLYEDLSKRPAQWWQWSQRVLKQRSTSRE
ncbi:MAG: hypothetical protein AAB393_12705 [Bacteroidota bacterium]